MFTKLADRRLDTIKRRPAPTRGVQRRLRVNPSRQISSAILPRRARASLLRLWPPRMDAQAAERMHPLRPRLHTRQQGSEEPFRDHVLIQRTGAETVPAVHNWQSEVACGWSAVARACAYHCPKNYGDSRGQQGEPGWHRWGQLSALSNDLCQLPEAAGLFEH